MCLVRLRALENLEGQYLHLCTLVVWIYILCLVRSSFLVHILLQPGISHLNQAGLAGAASLWVAATILVVSLPIRVDACLGSIINICNDFN